jgi:hypothetical protein
MSMNKIFSLAVVAGALALSSAPASAESLTALEAAQISDRTVPSYGASATRGSDVSVTQQELDQFGNSARPDVDASASRGHDDSLVQIEDEQIPH